KHAADSLKLGFKDRILLNLVQGTMRPMKASLSAVTVEYGLYEGRFWLPKLNIAEGLFQMGFMRFPLKWEERFQFNRVNGVDSLAPVPRIPPGGVAADTILLADGNVSIGAQTGGPRTDTSAAARTAREDSLVRRYNARADSVKAIADKARAKGDTARARD